jgi:dihydroxyacid dehydratase/phosphogluconate dehydratase
MRWLPIVALVACKGGGVTKAHEVCAKAAAMFERCEELSGEGSDKKLQNELAVDRWRGLCRAVLTGKTEQLMPDALGLYRSMDEATKAALRLEAECTAKAATCAEYAACSK